VHSGTLSRGVALQLGTQEADSESVLVRLIGDGSPTLDEGEDYVVLALHALPKASRPVEFMIHLPGDRVTDWGWFEAHLFELVDPALPPNWVCEQSRHGLSLLPAAWTRRGYWDDLFADDRARVERAWSDHRAERDLILAHAGRPPGREGSIRVCGPRSAPTAD
jgi:hypothetical protein